ncbi:flagellar motor switch protein FliG [Hoeflea prorocentri]|uniref:Flagellar motor switch protein FliG n=1 Tax=Hoeflea prorocentri TaxID=1922333 RepID=A0A9X3ZI07_9HYPH|nr:flagellar motor switch protein FliG [Hoeflea prorocentri]MCY6382407.1 flagellar motor switch protein FliG [Hoeflea prorocentri]MDA5400207.1 flagellar motor switch protein FliG [Hoeflea prorocentri]
MMDGYEELSGGNAVGQPLSKSQKAAAILIAMGKPVAGKLLKFFSPTELQTIISSAQSLRSIPPQELEDVVSEFEDLFTEGTGLMDNAKAMQGILEEGLEPEELDGLLAEGKTSGSTKSSIWDQLQETDPAFIGRFLTNEHPQTIAYVVSMLPSSFAAKILLEVPEKNRANIVHRAVNMKSVNPKIAEIIEQRVSQMVSELDDQKGDEATNRVADLMNELEKPVVDALLTELESINSEDAARVKPLVFLFDDIVEMPARSRVTLLDDMGAETITVALRNAGDEVKEAVLSSIGARQRRMIEADLSEDMPNITQRDIAVARRSITQEAIRLASQGQIELTEEQESEAA